MAADPKQSQDEASEFADFMADISEEIAQRVESLGVPVPATPDIPPSPAPSPDRRTPSAGAASADGMILEWENVTDRMLEDML